MNNCPKRSTIIVLDYRSILLRHNKQLYRHKGKWWISIFLITGSVFTHGLLRWWHWQVHIIPRCQWSNREGSGHNLPVPSITKVHSIQAVYIIIRMHRQAITNFVIISLQKNLNLIKKSFTKLLIVLTELQWTTNSLTICRIIFLIQTNGILANMKSAQFELRINIMLSFFPKKMRCFDKEMLCIHIEFWSMQLDRTFSS